MYSQNLQMSTAQAVPEVAGGDEAGDNLWAYVAQVRPLIEEELLKHLPLAPAPFGGRFNDALRWSLFPGGKRLRPVLTLLGAEIVGGSGEDVLAAAAGVEYVHTSSLIFDDLPCMDNAAERRGRASVHQRYGEGLAVLVALALMNSSYGLIFHVPSSNADGVRSQLESEAMIRAHCELVECIGTNGMVVGQTVDLADNVEAEESRAPVDVLNLKTSALMRMALRVGAMLAGGKPDELNALSRYADLIGDAYQTSDDVLDLAEDKLLVEGNRRATLALEQGADGALRRVGTLVAEAKQVLTEQFGNTSAANRLSEMADYIAKRSA